MRDARVYNCFMMHSDLHAADLTASIFVHTTLAGSDLRDALLEATSLERVDLRSALLSATDTTRRWYESQQQDPDYGPSWI
jgi:uncharacterized protein YjbI with pentapeptide repeats